MQDRKRLVEGYIDAMQREDFEALGQMRHPDFVALYPQSGELVRGHDNWVAIARAYPGRPATDESPVQLDVRQIHGRAAPHVRVSRSLPMGMPVITIAEGGDRVTVEFNARYPDGNEYFVVSIAHLRDGLVAKEITYWAEPFDPPGWRSQYVESIEE